MKDLFCKITGIFSLILGGLSLQASPTPSDSINHLIAPLTHSLHLQADSEDMKKIYQQAVSLQKEIGDQATLHLMQLGADYIEYMTPLILPQPDEEYHPPLSNFLQLLPVLEIIEKFYSPQMIVTSFSCEALLSFFGAANPSLNDQKYYLKLFAYLIHEANHDQDLAWLTIEWARRFMHPAHTMDICTEITQIVYDYLKDLPSGTPPLCLIQAENQLKIHEWDDTRTLPELNKAIFEGSASYPEKAAGKWRLV